MDEFNNNISNLQRQDSSTPDDLSLLKDENNLMTQRIKNMETEIEKLNKIIANYNPDSVKLQIVVNEKDKEILGLLDKIDRLESKVAKNIDLKVS